jgi:four helix bundle protein
MASLSLQVSGITNPYLFITSCRRIWHESIIQRKSFAFALQIVQLYKKLREQREYVLSKQLFESGTSIGANVAEATAGQSRKDFLSKMAIASKEARETKFWLRLLR